MKKMSAVLCILMGSIFGWAITINTTSPNLGITFMSANEAQPHLTFNELVSKLDGLVMPVIKIYPADPDPVTNAPEEGDMFIVPAGGTGDWDGEDDNLALYINEAWAFFTPKYGWKVSVAPALSLSYSEMLQYTDNGWRPDLTYTSVSDFGVIDSFFVGNESGDAHVRIQMIDSIPNIQLLDSDGRFSNIWTGKISSNQAQFGEALPNYLSSDGVLATNGALVIGASSALTYTDPVENSSAKIFVDYSSGDLMVKLKFGDVTKTATLVDFSAL